LNQGDTNVEAATMKPDGERMRSAVTALQHAQKRLVPIDDDPIQELWNIRQLHREQRYEEVEQRLTRILDWRLLEQR
jgi:hypothetical protein